MFKPENSNAEASDSGATAGNTLNNADKAYNNAQNSSQE